MPPRRIDTRPRRSCGSATPATSSAVVKLSARLTSSDLTYLVRGREGCGGGSGWRVRIRVGAKVKQGLGEGWVKVRVRGRVVEAHPVPSMERSISDTEWCANVLAWTFPASGCDR